MLHKRLKPHGLRQIILYVILLLPVSVFASNTIFIPAWFYAPDPDISAGIDVHYPLEVGAIAGQPGMIGPPVDGQRQTWLDNLSAYRKDVLNGTSKPEVYHDLDYKGSPLWMRLNTNLSVAMQLEPGQTITVTINAKGLGGTGKLCLAFDIHEKAGDWKKVGTTQVVSVFSFPLDLQRHNVTQQVTIPAFDSDQQFLRMILGMDPASDPKPACVRMYSATIESMPDRAAVLAKAYNPYERDKPNNPLDLSLYDRADLQWLSTNFVCHFTFMYDKSFYDPASGYKLDSFIEDGVKEFGGYDSVLLWHAYPRIGVDDRNQFDFYRDMPGGLKGVRSVVDAFHDRGIKVFINYNPWDRGVRREAVSDEEALAEMVAALDVDGVFLDTMNAASEKLRKKIDAKRSGVVFVPEGHPLTQEIGGLMGSWFQMFSKYPFSPVLLHHKYLEPRHMEYQINRWAGLKPDNRNHNDEIVNAFFNGSGMMIWENIFGTYNPWNIQDRALWRRGYRILKSFPKHFVKGGPDPFYPTRAEDVYAHRWTLGDITIFTMVNAGSPKNDIPFLKWNAGLKYFDLWNGKELRTHPSESGYVEVTGSIDQLGAIIALREDQINAELKDLLKAQQCDAATPLPEKDIRNIADSVIDARPVAKTTPAKDTPPGMVLVPSASFTMNIEHVRREQGCYPDPGTSHDKRGQFLQGWDFGELMQHHVQPKVNAFYIDEAEVTNAEYKIFLQKSGYQPKHPENFLKHWPNGVMPPELADHPVVYVDLDDARAYAAWAGKRLPTEEEWHLAAQGTDGRAWPWGTEFDENKCNTTGDCTMPVRSLPEGKSPYGCYHVAGNVYEWTESYRDDGHTRWCIIRGGSYYNPNTGSVWYFDSGPRPCTHHAKFILMWPGLDRCATIGFRCVKDIEL